MGNSGCTQKPKKQSQRKKTNSIVSTNTIQALDMQVFQLQTNGKQEEALEALNQLLQILVEQHGEKHEQVASTYYKIGSSYYNLKNFDEAMSAFDKCLAIRLNLFGKPNRAVVNAYICIAKTFFKKKKFEQSLENIKQALASYHQPHVQSEKNSKDHTVDVCIEMAAQTHQHGYLRASLDYKEMALKVKKTYMDAKNRDVVKLEKEVATFKHALNHLDKLDQHIFQGPDVRNVNSEKADEEITSFAVIGGEDSTIECSICCGDVTAGERIRTLSCKHIFHTNCVDKWLVVNLKCPNCRSDIIHLPESNSASQQQIPAAR